MKKVLIGLVVLIALVGGGVFYVYSNLGSIVKTAVEKGGSEVTGVSVTLDSVDLVIQEGKAALSGFMVGNPDGFDTEYAVSLGGISVAIDPTTVGSDTIVINSVRVDAPKVIYELGGSGSNIDAIQRNVERFTGASSSSSESAASDSEGPKIIIEDLIIAGGEVAVSAGFLAGEKLGVSLPEIHLTNLGKEEGGASSADIAAEIMAAMNDAILGSVGKLDLSGMMDGAAAAASEATEAATKALGDVSGEATDAAAGAAEAAGSAVQGAVGNLLNSN